MLILSPKNDDTTGLFPVCLPSWFFSLLLICFFGVGNLSGQGNPMFPSGQTRAVIVGISDYQNISDLDYAHRDAEALAAYLQSKAGGEVPAENIRLLLNAEATQMQFAMALDWLEEESRPGDRAYIYFSGHGDVEKKTARQRGFLLTYDAPTTTYMAGGAFPILFLQDIISVLATEKDVEVILMADACRAGKLAGNTIGGNHVTAEHLAESFANEIKILSCQKDELSQEGNQWGEGRGVFSYHLIDGLTGLADESGDNEVNLREIRNYLESQVGEETAGDQLPVVIGDLSHRIAKVDPNTLALLQEKKSLENTERSLAKNTRGLKPSGPDSTVWKLYLNFKEALKERHLLYPEEGAAYTIYRQIKDEKDIEDYKSEMKRTLAVALHDETQQAINDYLSASPQELQERWAHNERYGQYPDYLRISAELLGSDHFMYEDLRVKQAYFEGLRLRLRGEEERDKNYFESALEKQKAAIRMDSSAAYAYNELGLLLRRLGKEKEAVSYFESANEYSPSWVIPMANSISNYTDLGQVQEALQAGRKALQLDSAFALTYHNLGYAYDVAEDWEKAIEHYKKAIQLNPDYTKTYINLGLLYYGLDQFDHTEKYFLRYAEKTPGEPDIWSDLGIVAGRQNNFEAAKKYFEKAIITDPEYSDAYLNLAELFLNSDQLEPAKKALEEYLKRRADQQDGHLMMAAVLARQGLPEEALAELKLAIENGFEDGQKLAEDKSFESLRNRRDFQELLERIKR